MTTTTVSQAVARREAGPDNLVRQSRGWFATIVPSHIDASAFVALVIAYLRRNPKLAAAATRNPASFMAALSECARLGLVPGDTFHLVPFEDRRNETVEITGIIDYTGEIELIYRAGAVASVKAEIVCSRDVFRFTTDMDCPEHAPNWFGDRGDLIGAYAYAVMKDGATSKVVVYSKAEIDRVMAVSKTKDLPDSPWKKWYDRMALKTVIHRLEHFVPTSAEYRREQLRAAAEVAQSVNSTPGPAAADAVFSPAATPQDIHEAEIISDETPPGTLSNEAAKQEGRPPRAAKRELAAMDQLLRSLQLGEDADVSALLEWLCGAPFNGSRSHVQTVTEYLQGRLEASGGDTAEAASAIWVAYGIDQDAAEASGSTPGGGDG